MSIRVSLILVILLSLSSILGTWVYIEFLNSEDTVEESPYLYRISNKDMITVDIKTKQKELSIEKRDDRDGLWFFKTLINTPLNLN